MGEVSNRGAVLEKKVHSSNHTTDRSPTLLDAFGYNQCDADLITSRKCIDSKPDNQSVVER